MYFHGFSCIFMYFLISSCIFIVFIVFFMNLQQNRSGAQKIKTLHISPRSGTYASVLAKLRGVDFRASLSRLNTRQDAAARPTGMATDFINSN